MEIRAVGIRDRMNRIVLMTVLVLSSGLAALAQQPTGRIMGSSGEHGRDLRNSHILAL